MVWQISFWGLGGQLHKIHYMIHYMRGISAIFSSTGKLIYVIFEFTVIPGNVNLYSFRTDVGLVVRMSVSGNRGCKFKSRHQYVVSLSKTLYLHCFSRLSCKMSTRCGQPCEGCSVL